MNLLPIPRKVTPKVGKVSFAEGWKLDAPDDLASLECLADLKFLRPSGARVLRLRLDGVARVLPLGLADESHRIELSPSLIELSAATRAGILRGVQTLKQLAREGGVDACVIEDSPALPLRAMHIDFRPKSYYFDYLLATIDRLAEMKYNCLLVEWENKFPFKRRREVVHPEALTWEQIDALKARCARHGIAIMPLIQTFGHLQFALSVPQNARLREVADNSSEICPLKPDAVELVRDLVRDVIDGHPESRFIHLGADEAYVMGSCPECRAHCEKVGRSAHFVDHMKKIIAVVHEAGRIPVMWNDMLIAHPEAVAMLPKPLVMLDWHYHTFGVWTESVAAWQHQGPFTADNMHSAPEVFRREFASYVAGRHPTKAKLLRAFPYTKYFMDKGFPTIVGPSSCCWGDPGTNPNFDTHTSNIWGFAASAAMDGALGLALTSWQVRRHPWEVQMWLIALAAETAWNPREGVRDDFDARYMETQHGIDDVSIPKAFRLLDRRMDEDRCDHYGRLFIDQERRWAEPPIADQLAEKDRKGQLADDAPTQAKARETLERARQALDVFRRFTNKARRHSLDARFWELAAEETIFRVELFEALRRVYLARRSVVGGDLRVPPSSSVDAGGHMGPPLRRLVQRTLDDGDALYARARTLWTKLLPPLTLDEEILTRWGEPREYLAKETQG